MTGYEDGFGLGVTVERKFAPRRVMHGRLPSPTARVATFLRWRVGGQARLGGKRHPDCATPDGEVNPRGPEAVIGGAMRTTLAVFRCALEFDVGKCVRFIEGYDE